MSIDWRFKDVAAEVLPDFLMMHTDDSARILVELHEDNGPEAWRQLACRYNPIGETYILDRMDKLMNVNRCKSMVEIPAAISRWERAHADYVSRSGGQCVPENWKLPILFKMVPESEKERIRMHFKYASAEEKTYQAFSRILIEMAGEKAYDQHRGSKDHMDCSTADLESEFRYSAAEWEEYQNQQQEEAKYSQAEWDEYLAEISYLGNGKASRRIARSSRTGRKRRTPSVLRRVFRLCSQRQG